MIYDVAIIGSGPAGFEAAVIAAGAGKRTVLVTATPPGGRATVGSLLPSKVWLHTAQEHNERQRSSRNHSVDVDSSYQRDGSTKISRLTNESAAMAATHVRDTIAQRVAWTTNQLEERGVTVIHGQATLDDVHRLKISTQPDGEKTVEASKIVFATGSEPIFFPGVKPDGKRLIAPRHTQHLTEIPRRIVMIGGGVTGVEYASVFARLGSEVHLVSYDELLPRSDREYTDRLRSVLTAMGITIETGVAVATATNTGEAVVVETNDGHRIDGDYAFIATGRSGDLTFLNDARVSLETDKSGQFLKVNEYGQTSEPSIYACGDIAGPPLIANKALAEARRAINHIVADGQLEDSANSTTRLPLIEAVYTHPQVAGIGPVNELAQRDDLTLHRRSYASSMLAFVHTDTNETWGEIKVWADSSGRILGASAFGENAAEILTPVQLAMHHGISFEALSNAPFAYPSWSEVVSSAIG
jgi:pyruvate/2-oxoglutarate dehydrogenase complex dihydrolipoamide dehydrogenase (E3) component